MAILKEVKSNYGRIKNYIDGAWVDSESPKSLAADVSFWKARGFELREIETAFEFETLDDARRLLGFYFGDRGHREARLSLSFRVGCFIGLAGEVVR